MDYKIRNSIPGILEAGENRIVYYPEKGGKRILENLNGNWEAFGRPESDNDREWEKQKLTEEDQRIIGKYSLM